MSRVEAAKIKACREEEDDRQVQGQVELARGRRVAAHYGVHLQQSRVTAVCMVEAVAQQRLAVRWGRPGIFSERHSVVAREHLERASASASAGAVC